MEKSGKGTKADRANHDEKGDGRETCGIVMPISAIDGCDATHWANVLQILGEAVTAAGFEPQLVSSSADIGVIQTRIVQNLYENPIVVCDVSGKNPNVMFELGLRLAFDKPVIIVKDDTTSYSFDTSPIEHLEYRRDLRYQNVVEFKQALADRIQATVVKSKADKDYSPFLKHFGRFTVSTLETKEVSSNEYMLKKLDDLQNEVQRLHVRSIRPDDLKFRPEPWLLANLIEPMTPNTRVELVVADVMSQFPDLDLNNRNMRNEAWRQIKQALLEHGLPASDKRISEALEWYLSTRLKEKFDISE